MGLRVGSYNTTEHHVPLSHAYRASITTREDLFGVHLSIGDLNLHPHQNIGAKGRGLGRPIPTVEPRQVNAVQRACNVLGRIYLTVTINLTLLNGGPPNIVTTTVYSVIVG